MSIGTLIQWCYATVNFWWGCTKVSAGCANCYAERHAKRLGRGRATWGPSGLRWLRVGEACLELLKLEQLAVKKGERLRIFINSMSDTFEDRRDLDSARNILYTIARCVPHLDLLVLTKRIELVEQLVPDQWKGSVVGQRWPDNVWLGFSAENQETFDARWPVAEHLARSFYIPCVFCSAEPLLGPLDISAAQFGSGGPGGEDEPDTRPLDWLIVGGESGQSARPCAQEWIGRIVEQGREFEIPIFVKQLGAYVVSEERTAGASLFTRPDKLRPKDYAPNGEVWAWRAGLKDGHGGDISEWPAELRVREFPQPSMINGVQA